MPSDNLVKIILELEDKASQAAKKADELIKKFGDTAQQSNNKASTAVQKLNHNYAEAANKVTNIVKSSERVGAIGSKQFERYNDSIQKSIVNFNRLDSETQDMLKYLSQMSDKGRETFVGMSSKAQECIAKFEALENESNSFGNTLEFTKSKFSLMGTNVDTVKGKVQVLGSSFISYVSPKITTLSGEIKSKLSSAVQTVKSKIESLGSAFSGIGGVISSVFGAIGMNSFKDMTIGASMARDSIKSLTFSINGAGQETNNLWNKWDTMTTKSLVSLDQLSQAMNTIKMSTGMTTPQLSKMSDVVNNIGQRAILMGKSGDEAISLMQAAGKGLNGEFQMLKDNFGISKEKLEELGWSGAADDVEGYTEALQKYLDQSGDLGDTLDGTTGKVETFSKNMRIAGRKIGDEFIPYVDMALDKLNAWTDPETGNGLGQWIVGIMGLGSAFMTLAPAITPTLQAMQYFWDSAKWVKDKLSNLEETIQGMHGKWDSFKEKVNSAKDKLVNFKDKVVDAKSKLTDFIGKIREIATDKIDLLKKKFIDLKKNIISAKNDLIKFLGKIREIAAEKIANLADKFRTLASNISLAGIKAKLYAAYQWLVNAATAVWNALLDANPVMLIVIAVAALVAALLYLYNTNETVRNGIDGFLAALGGVGEFLMGSIVPSLQGLWGILQPIGEFLVGAFLPVWQLIVNIFTLVYATVMQIIDVFSQFLSGQITLPQMLSMVWELISNMFFTVLGTIINFVISWAGQLIGNAISAASGFVNGIITWISSLPGRVWSWLSQTTSRIITAGGQWVNTAKQKASEMVNGAVTNVQQMPGKIYTEFTKVPDRIKDAIPKAIAAAIDFGKGILKGVLDALGIHSPGDIQKGIEAEFNNTVGKIKDVIAPAGVYARQLGETIMDKFGSVKLSLNTDDLMPYTDLDMDPLENLDLGGLDLSNMNTGLASAMGMTDTTNTMIGESYNNLAAMMQNTLSSMVLADQLAYGSIQSNDINTFNTIQNSLNMNLLSMSNNLRAQLNQMLLNHKNAMGSADTTTRTHLASMLLQTEKVTGEMRFAWSVMATSIIDAAGRIKNEATTYFNQLSVTIGTFYKKLQNPSQWGSGPGSSTVHSNRRVGYDPSVGSRITRNVANAMRVENKAPSYITGSTASTLPLQKGYLEYLNINQSSRIKVNDLIQSGAIKEEYLSLLSSDAAGWEDTVSPNVNYIKSIARNWSMKGPQIPTGAGIVNTGMAFKVSDFENGAPKISFDAFEKIARAIFTTVPYPSSMYFNSDRYGSWQNAMAHGEMNCWDGANCLLALAHMCGFSGYRASGTWNGIAHVFPVINGKKMDTTSMQNRGNWEGVAAGNIQINMPKVMGKSTPNRSNLDGMFNIENIFENSSDDKEIVKETSSEEITLNLNHNVDVTVDGETENIDVNALINEIKASITDKDLINKIADALIKRDKRIIRMGGAI